MTTTAQQLQEHIDNAIDSHDKTVADRGDPPPSPNDNEVLQHAIRRIVMQADIPVRHKYRQVDLFVNDEDERELRFSGHLQYFLDKNEAPPADFEATLPEGREVDPEDPNAVPGPDGDDPTTSDTANGGAPKPPAGEGDDGDSE